MLRRRNNPITRSITALFAVLRNFNGNHACCGLLLVSCLLLSPATAAAADTQTSPEVDAEQEKVPDRNEILRQIFGAQDLYFYHRENRPDPFLPFIQEKVIQQNAQGGGVEEIPQEELTGLRKFEPGQLSLVAIVFRGNSPIAMVQDPVGQGYIVKEGMKIGRYGLVEEITPNAVVIQQTTRTWDQEKLFKRVEMVLRKEGEQ